MAEAANMLDCDRSAVVKMIRRGELQPYDKLPGQTGAYLLTRSHIEKLAAKRAAS